MPTIREVSLSKYFDHTALAPGITVDNIAILCAEALEYDFASVCVNSGNIPFVAAHLRDTSVKICAVVGFPLGAMSTEAKAFETEYCCKKGASEIDMVMNIGLLKSKCYELVKEDIQRVVAVCNQHGVCCKVILEVCLLSEEEKIIAAKICLDTGANFIKTSTGFSSGGAILLDVITLSKIAHDGGILFKASGGIRDGRSALDMIRYRILFHLINWTLNISILTQVNFFCRGGADRLGTSATIKVYNECVSILRSEVDSSLSDVPAIPLSCSDGNTHNNEGY